VREYASLNQHQALAPSWPVKGLRPQMGRNTGCCPAPSRCTPYALAHAAVPPHFAQEWQHHPTDMLQQIEVDFGCCGCATNDTGTCACDCACACACVCVRVRVCVCVCFELPGTCASNHLSHSLSPPLSLSLLLPPLPSSLSLPLSICAPSHPLSTLPMPLPLPQPRSSRASAKAQ